MRIHRVCQSLKLAFWNQAILNLMRYVSTLGQETPTIVSLHCSNKWPLASGGIALKIISTEVWARCNSILHSTSSIYKLYIYWSNHNSNNHGIISTTLATCIREDKETNETRRKHLTCINLYVPSGSFWHVCLFCQNFVLSIPPSFDISWLPDFLHPHRRGDSYSLEGLANARAFHDIQGIWDNDNTDRCMYIQCIFNVHINKTTVGHLRSLKLTSNIPDIKLCRPSITVTLRGTSQDIIHHHTIVHQENTLTITVIDTYGTEKGDIR